MDYWRVTDTTEMQIKAALEGAGGVRLDEMCSCRLDRAVENVELFCKPEGGCEALDRVGDWRLARGEGGFGCSGVEG